jgi:hypothetical protein
MPRTRAHTHQRPGGKPANHLSAEAHIWKHTGESLPIHPLSNTLTHIFAHIDLA